MKKTILSTLALCCIVAGGCATNDNDAKHREEERCGEIKPGLITSVNANCVIIPQDPVDPAMQTVEWKGQKVGFCCKGCVPKWNKMSDAQKDAALAKVVTGK